MKRKRTGSDPDKRQKSIRVDEEEEEEVTWELNPEAISMDVTESTGGEVMNPVHRRRRRKKSSTKRRSRVSLKTKMTKKLKLREKKLKNELKQVQRDLRSLRCRRKKK